MKTIIIDENYEGVKINRIVEGDQIVDLGNQIVEGDQIVDLGNQIVEGDQIVDLGNQIVEGDQRIEGCQTVEVYEKD